MVSGLVAPLIQPTSLNTCSELLGSMSPIRLVSLRIPERSSVRMYADMCGAYHDPVHVGKSTTREPLLSRKEKEALR